MVIKINDLTATALGYDGVAITKEKSPKYEIVNGLIKMINELYKSDKGMKELFKNILPNENSFDDFDFIEFCYGEYKIKKMAERTYILYNDNKQLKQFDSAGTVLMYLFDLVALSSKKTFVRIEKFINYITKLKMDFISILENKI